MYKLEISKFIEVHEEAREVQEEAVREST